MARIFLWSETFWPSIGGAEVLGLELIEALQRRGHEFLVVVCAWRETSAPAATSIGNVEISRLVLHPPTPGHELDWLFETRQRVRTLRDRFAADVSHYWTLGASAFLHLDARMASGPSLVTVHDTLPDRCVASHTALGQMLRQASWVAPVSESALAHLRRQVPAIAERSSAIPNSLPLPPRGPAPPPSGPPRVLCLGRLEPRKGFDLALRAFARAAPRFPGARLIVAGEGSARRALERLALDLGLGHDRIEFLGVVMPTEVPELLTGAHVVVMPSRIEPFGLVGLQAAQMARPLIASRTGGLADLVEDGQTGLLVESGDRDTLERALVTLLEHPERARTMGAAARTRALERFGWERCVDAYEQAYAQLRAGGSDVNGP